MRGAVGVIAFAAVVQLPSRISEACSPPPCGPSFLVPATGSTIPANTPALYWRSRAAYANPLPRDPTLVTLTTTTDPTTPLALTATSVGTTVWSSDWTLAFAQPLVAGTSYTVTDNNLCSSAQLIPAAKTTFAVGPAAPLPTQLGTLARAPNALRVLDLDTSDGGCFAPTETVSTRIQIVLSPEAAAWRDVLHYETFVDDQRWMKAGLQGSWTAPGASPQGRGVDLIYRVCEAYETGVTKGVSSGVHTVRMRATLPGTNVVLSTPPIDVDLECPPIAIDVDFVDSDTDTLAEPTGCGCTSGGASSVAPFFLLLATLRRITRRGPCRRLPS